LNTSQSKLLTNNKGTNLIIYRYTQRSGVRPFGISVLVGGFNVDNQPVLYHSEPSGGLSAWKTTAIGKNADKIIELLEKSYEDNIAYDKGLTLVIESMLEYVEAGSKNIEVSVMVFGKEMINLADDEIEVVISAIEEKKKKNNN